jgi:hypothetical protein
MSYIALLFLWPSWPCFVFLTLFLLPLHPLILSGSSVRGTSGFFLTEWLCTCNGPRLCSALTSAFSYSGLPFMPSYSFSFSSGFLSCSSLGPFPFLSLCFFFIHSHSRGSPPDAPLFGGPLRLDPHLTFPSFHRSSASLAHAHGLSFYVPT